MLKPLGESGCLVVGFLRAVVSTGVFVFMTTICVQADPIHSAVGVTIDALSGRHEVGNGEERLNFVPIPIVEVESRYRAMQLRFETIPSIPFSYGPGNLQSTRLGVFNGSIRQYFAGAWFVGIGETLYNQHTYYPDGFTTDDAQEQYSRVAGLRFEGGRDFHIARVVSLEVRGAANPVMHGIQYTRSIEGYLCPLTGPGDTRSSCSPVFRESAVNERAAQIDLGARLVRTVGRGDVLVGLRYLNYSARYVATNRRNRVAPYLDGRLADRNVGVLPLIGYRLRF